MNSTNTPTLVLIHGAWHDGRAWDDTAEHLRAQGYEVHTPTVAGHGPDGDRTTTLDGAVDSIVEYIEENDLTNVALVGHSLGGVYISQAAPRIADRLSRLVFLVAFVLSDGESLYDVLPEALRDNLLNSTNDDGVIPPDYAFVRNGFMSTADEAATREVFAELSPQGDTTFSVRVDQSGFETLVADGEVGISYIDVSGDVLLGPDGWYSAFGERLGAGVRVIRVAGESHDLMHTDPAECAEAIIAAARD
ncbi:alpha/beta fold hydrolase [Stackebrandtia nassauensis]|uniref:Alpha/beta hydrolase fold protein n=1 Tax=Stackebrandtia nassauensis (strain DSM 44728 / CIP 108903 / NRRL B-16338 / NBRC 102104 / LLR-40K-21) TaxID=446470 RepID=D3Q2D8_STANL|nr:alpha/beta hydrolase [Stackebrandtia nassauensis]ADD43871.1 alpha/beta hydrolase fold protein [Stackebrandtia nassauensis DSM 44728]